VSAATAAVVELGLTPSREISNGGLDANYLHAKGIPTVTLGAGQHRAHSLDEFVDLEEYHGGCRLALALASSAGGQPSAG
jgi:tripeptide aminopeptidase